MRIMPFFGQKLLNTQHSLGRCAPKSPIMKWANMFRVFKKNSLKLHTASHNNTNWYTDTDGFLEHSPSGGSLLRGTCPPEDYSRGFFGGRGSPLIVA